MQSKHYGKISLYTMSVNYAKQQGFVPNTPNIGDDECEKFYGCVKINSITILESTGSVQKDVEAALMKSLSEINVALNFVCKEWQDA